jgi:hypothetical protein
MSDDQETRVVPNPTLPIPDITGETGTDSLYTR